MTTDAHISVYSIRHSVLISLGRMVAYESFILTPLNETVALNHLFRTRRAREDKVSSMQTKSYDCHRHVYWQSYLSVRRCCLFTDKNRTLITKQGDAQLGSIMSYYIFVLFMHSLVLMCLL